MINMTIATRNVMVKQLPERLDRGHQRSFARDLHNVLNVYRPCLVLDCSRLRQMDRSAMQLLLYCLEQAMKRNGDVRLAGVAPEAIAILQSTGIDRLFRFFTSNPEAVRSFDRHLTEYLVQKPSGAEADAA